MQCCGKTIKRAINAAGYYKCRACQKSWISEAQAELRYQYTLEKLQWPEWQWKDIYWSDEAHFHNNSRAVEWVIRNSKERNCPNCTQKRRKTAASQWHVWSIVAYNYKGPLVFYEFGKGGGNVTLKEYTEHILPIVHRRQKQLARKNKEMIF